MRIPIYLAGSSRELERVRKWATILERSQLFTITLDWWRGAEEWAGRDRNLPRTEQVQRAGAAMQAVHEARLLWLLYPEQAISFGAPCELGIAIERRGQCGWPRIIVSGRDSGNSIFTGGADYRDEVDALGFDAVVRHARELQKLIATLASGVSR